MFATQLYEAILGSNIDSEDMGYAAYHACIDTPNVPCSF